MNDDIARGDAGSVPEAVWPPAPASPPAAAPPDPVFEFRPKSVLLMILLSVVTLWIYPYYWGWKQAKIVNRIVPSKPVTMQMFILTGVAVALMQIANLFSFHPNSDANRLFSLICTALSLWCAFNLASGLNRAFRVNARSHQYFHRVWTFFFSFYYLQYRINKNLRLRKAEGAHLPRV